MHTGTKNLTNDSKSIENDKHIANLVRSKLPSCTLVISNVTTRNYKNEIDKKVEAFNIKLSKFCKKNKINIIDKKNLQSCS